jgi:hypothetical protein
MYGKLSLIKAWVLLLWLTAVTNSNAQHSRIASLNLFGGAFDIVEDYKGGLLVLTDGLLLRFDADLRFLWHSQYERFSHKRIRYDAKNKLYIVSSQETGIGGYRMLAFNLNGEQVWTAKREVFSYPGAMNDKIEDFFIDSVKRRILIVGKTWYFQQRRQAYWSAVADMQGNILREDRRFYRKIEDNPISFSGLNKRPDGKGYFAFATDDFETYGAQTKIVRFDSNFNYLDSFPLLPLDRDPETLERTQYVAYNFYRLNDSEYCTTLETRSDSKIYYFIFDNNLRPLRHYDKENVPEIITKMGGHTQYGSFNLHNSNSFIRKTDADFNTIWERPIKIPIHPKLPEEWLPHTEDPIEKSHVIAARDGGFYGYAWHNWISGLLYVFKLDSLGRLYPNPPPERPELVVAVPNPARGQIRFDMPYHDLPLYPRHIQATFYDMLGRRCLEVEGDKFKTHDISALRPGMYIVKTRIRENGSERTLKVVVE